MKKVSFQEYTIKNRSKFNTVSKVRDFLSGKTIEIIAITGGHNYGPIGSKVTLTNTNNVTGTAIGQGIVGGNSITFSEFSVIFNYTKEEIHSYIKDLEKDKK